MKMKETTKYIVYTLKNKGTIVLFGKKKINGKFYEQKFLDKLAKKYTFNSSKIEECNDKESAKILYDYKIKHYKRKHWGNMPKYNWIDKSLKHYSRTQKKHGADIKKSELKDKKKTIAKHKGHCLISSKNLKIMTDKAYKLGYKDAKAGKKKDLSQISVDVGSKK